jgi:hypothetical protein
MDLTTARVYTKDPYIRNISYYLSPFVSAYDRLHCITGVWIPSFL